MNSIQYPILVNKNNGNNFTMLCNSYQYIIPIGKQGVELVAINGITNSPRPNIIAKHSDIDLQVKYNVDIISYNITNIKIDLTRLGRGP